MRSPGIDSSLSSVPAGVAEPPSGQLGHGQPERRGQRGEHQGDAVAHARRWSACRPSAGATPASGIVEPESDHGPGQLGGLGRRQPVQVRGHQECGGLVVGDLASRVPEDERTKVVGVELAVRRAWRPPRRAGRPSTPAPSAPELAGEAPRRANPSACTPSTSATVAPRSEKPARVPRSTGSPRGRRPPGAGV